MCLATSGFASGVGSILEFYPLKYRRSFQRPVPHLTDAQRLAIDWHRVGSYLAASIALVNESGPIQERQRENS
jgi:hypothetical protein